MKYYYPCNPNPLNPESKFFSELDRNTSWIAEVKKNGWRCLVYRESGLTLWTKHKTIINEPLKSIRDSLMSVPEQTILDGELIHSRRVKGAPDMLYLFDVLIFKGEMLFDFPFTRRRAILEIIYKEYLASDTIELARQVHIGKKALYQKSIEGLNEGIVLKKLDSKYPVSLTRCSQNPFWLKVKRIEKHIKTES